MALVVDKTVKYLGVPDSENFTIQCSKPMSQLNADDVKSADFWVGFTSFAHNQMCEGNIESGLPQNDPNHCWCWATSPDALYDGDWSTAHWSFPANYPTGIYMRNILVECALAHSQNTSLQNNASARIVMDIEAGEDTKIQNLFIEGSSYITCSYNEGQNTQNQVTDNRYIKPAILMIVNDILYVWIQDFVPYMSGFFCDSSTSQGYRSSQSFDDYSRLSNHNLAMGWTRALETGDMYTDSGTTTSVIFSYTVSDVDFNGVTADLNISLGASSYHKRASLSITDNEDKEIEKYYKAFTGFKFKVDNVWYKPIVTGGIVTGYTDDMTFTSEWDEWDNITGHNVPVTPPVPPCDDEDNDDPISTAGTPFGTGLAHYYVTTVDSTVLSQIAEAMSTWDIDATKKDLYRNLISCKLMKPPAGIPATPSVFEIYGVKPQYQGADITINAVDGNPDIAFDAIDIPRKFNDFRDYAPYSKAEIFIPYCGWTALPSHVIGRSVSVSYYADVIAGTVKAVVFCGNNVVAEAAGIMAVDIPFASQNVGAKVQAATTGLLSYGQGAFQTAVGIGQMVATKGQSGLKNVAQGLGGVIGGAAQMAMTANENWTEINGKSGDGTCLAGIDTIIVKITRPKYGDYEAPYYVPAEFPHTVGFIAMKKALVSSCTGLIICDNVDTSGIAGATDRERQLIKNYLENGIIVEHPEEP